VLWGLLWLGLTTRQCSSSSYSSSSRRRVPSFWTGTATSDVVVGVVNRFFSWHGRCDSRWCDPSSLGPMMHFSPRRGCTSFSFAATTNAPLPLLSLSTSSSSCCPCCFCCPLVLIALVLLWFPSFYDDLMECNTLARRVLARFVCALVGKLRSTSFVTTSFANSTMHFFHSTWLPHTLAVSHWLLISLVFIWLCWCLLSQCRLASLLAS